MNTISEMSESVDINTISTNNVSDNSLNCGQNASHFGNSTPVTTPEPKSVSNPSGSRSEIHYPGVQNPTRIYDSKENKKIVRIMTVMGYMFAVSLAAIVLSIYYAFLWNPNMQTNKMYNSTHSYIKTNTEQVLDKDNTSGIDSNHIQLSRQPIVSSAQLLTSSGNQSDTGLTTGSSFTPITSTTTNGQSLIFSLNSSLSLNHENRNASKELISKSLASNVEKTIETNKIIGREGKTTKILNETNQTEINIIDNQLEIGLNSSQTHD